MKAGQKAINDLQQVGALNLFNEEPKVLKRVSQKNSDPPIKKTTSEGELYACIRDINAQT